MLLDIPLISDSAAWSGIRGFPRQVYLVLLNGRIKFLDCRYEECFLLRYLCLDPSVSSTQAISPLGDGGGGISDPSEKATFPGHLLSMERLILFACGAHVAWCYRQDSMWSKKEINLSTPSSGVKLGVRKCHAWITFSYWVVWCKAPCHCVFPTILWFPNKFYFS